MDWRDCREPAAAADDCQRADTHCPGAWTGADAGRYQDTDRDVRNDLRSPYATAQQGARADRGRRRQADEGIRCADGEPGRVRAARVRKPVGVSLARRVDVEGCNAKLEIQNSNGDICILRLEF